MHSAFTIDAEWLNYPCQNRASSSTAGNVIVKTMSVSESYFRGTSTTTRLFQTEDTKPRQDRQPLPTKEKKFPLIATASTSRHTQIMSCPSLLCAEMTSNYSIRKPAFILTRRPPPALSFLLIRKQTSVATKETITFVSYDTLIRYPRPTAI
jgi:hypothetical protein